MTIAAFVGHATRGPRDTPITLTSFPEFAQHFGGLDHGSELGYAVHQFFLNGGAEAIVVVADTTGVHGLDDAARFDLLCLPGATDAAVLADAASYCHARRAFLIMDTPANVGGPVAMAAHAQGAGLPEHDHAAAYYPWLHIADPLDSTTPRLTPPSATVAGVYARTDRTGGVWRAPAGTEASLLGVRALAHTMTDAESDTLNRLAVNCLRDFPTYGPVVWGARTRRGADEQSDEFKYVPIRRLALSIEDSLSRATQWTVFEPNGEALWTRLRAEVGAFMHDLFVSGAFQGVTPRDAYFVKCDSDTTTQHDVDDGAVNLVVGFAPVKPAEFVALSLRLITARGNG